MEDGGVVRERRRGGGCLGAAAALVLILAVLAAGFWFLGDTIKRQFMAPSPRATIAATSDAATVVFTGNLGYFANVEAALRLAREVMPRVRARRPDARLHLAGARPDRALQQLARDGACTLEAEVPDMGAVLRRATIAVAPLRAGSGQQLKVLEAMASGTPVVSTPLSAVGEPGVHLRVAESADALAAEITALLDDPGARRTLAARARAFVERDHTWALSAERLDALWRRAVAPEA